VLVDEYQDTNHLQGRLLRSLRPGGDGLTWSRWSAIDLSFRAATIRNILDFRAVPQARVSGSSRTPQHPADSGGDTA